MNRPVPPPSQSPSYGSVYAPPKRWPWIVGATVGVLLVAGLAIALVLGRGEAPEEEIAPAFEEAGEGAEGGESPAVWEPGRRKSLDQRLAEATRDARRRQREEGTAGAPLGGEGGSGGGGMADLDATFDSGTGGGGGGGMATLDSTFEPSREDIERRQKETFTPWMGDATPEQWQSMSQSERARRMDDWQKKENRKREQEEKERRRGGRGKR